MKDIETYLKDNNFWNEDNLKAHAEQHNVQVISSKDYPFLVMLHYKNACIFENDWNPFARMCRGIILDMHSKRVLAYPYEKFFNLSQMPETSYDVLKDKKEFEVSEKLDGSMILVFQDPSTGEFVATTKGSFDSPHGKVATTLLQNLPNYQQVIEYAKKGTLMFELISSEFRIVIDYKKKEYPEGLYLIGGRKNCTGELLTYAEVAEIAKELGLPCPKTYQFESLDQLIEKTKDLPMSEEGFVLRYPDGLMVKVKGAAYLKAHRFISQLSDKNILEAMKEGVEEQMLEVAPDEFQREILEKVAYFKSRKVDILNQCYQYFHDAPKEDRKTFALWVNQNAKSYLKGCLFQLFDCKRLSDKALYDIISKVEKPSVETRI